MKHNPSTFFASVVILSCLLQTTRIITDVGITAAPTARENQTQVPTFVDTASRSAHGESNVLIIDTEEEKKWKSPTQNTEINDLKKQAAGLAQQNTDIKKLQY